MLINGSSVEVHSMAMNSNTFFSLSLALSRPLSGDSFNKYLYMYTYDSV